MSVRLQLVLFSSLAFASGTTLLIRPSIIVRSPLETHLRALTGLSSTPLDNQLLAIAAIPIFAIGLIYCAVIFTGDEKFVRFSGKSWNSGDGLLTKAFSSGEINYGIDIGVSFIVYGSRVDGVVYDSCC